MTNPKLEVGDKVTALGAGPWEVVDILANPDRVTIKLLGAEDHLKTVPLKGVSSLKKSREDFSQAAARIVREATERD